MTTVSGTATVPEGVPPIDGVTLLVEVRDVTLADAPSVVVASRTYPGVTVRPGASLPFQVSLPEVPPGAVLTLRVHVDVSGDGTVAPGDLLSTRFHPVPDRDGPATDVPLTAV